MPRSAGRIKPRKVRPQPFGLTAGQRPSTSAGSAPDGERHFAHVRAAYGLSGPWTLGDNALTYRLEGALQWSPHALPAVEKTTLGHFPYLRGYAPAEVAGDRGLGATCEVVRRGSISQGMKPVVPFGFASVGQVSSDGRWHLWAWGCGASAQVGCLPKPGLLCHCVMAHFRAKAKPHFS
jgi:hemolysin activation/secretion protein